MKLEARSARTAVKARRSCGDLAISRVRADAYTGRVLTGLSDALTLPAFDDVRRAVADPASPGGSVSLVRGLLPALISRTAKTGTVLVVTATTREAEDLARALADHLPQESVAVFPSWETLPHERLSPRSDTVGERLTVLRRLAYPGADGDSPLRVVIAPVRAALQPLVKGLAHLEPVDLRVGDRVDLTELSETLSGLAYTRVDMVSRRGEFAVRGGIIDVFPPTAESALRLEFFDDEIEEIRPFAVADQRSQNPDPDGPAPRLYAPPCREVLLTAKVRERAAALAETTPAAADMLGRIAAGVAVEGMESLAPVLADGMEPLVAVVPQDTRVLVVEPERVARRAEDLVRTSDEFLAAAWESASDGAQAPVDLSAANFRTLEQTREAAGVLNLPWWELGGFAVDEELTAAGDEVYTVPAREPRGYQGDVEAILGDVRTLVRDDWSVVVLTEGGGPGKRLVEVFADAEVPAAFVEAPTSRPRGASKSRSGPATAGSSWTSSGWPCSRRRTCSAVRAATSTRDMRKLPARRRRNQVDPLDLSPGDHVVHEQHGVGRFVEMVQRTAGKGKDAHTREYLVLEYAPSKRGHPGDRLYVPSDALDQVTRYVGGESPTLNKMGGSDLVEDEDAGAEGGQGDRRRARPPLLRSAGHAGPRIRS